MENNKIIEIKNLYMNFDKLEVLKGISFKLFHTLKNAPEAMQLRRYVKTYILNTR